MRGKKMNTNGSEIKGIRIRTLNLIMMIIFGAIFVTVFYTTILVSVRYKSFSNAVENYINYEQEAFLVQDSSDYLTEQVRLFVITNEKEYADNYFTEVNVTKRQEKSLKNMSQYDINEKTMEYLEIAVEQSKELTKREIYAMKLIALANQYDITEFDEQIQNMEISDEDYDLSSDEMRNKAIDMVFDSTYQDEKTLISENTNIFLNCIMDETSQIMENDYNHLSTIMFEQRIKLIVLAAIIIVDFILIFYLVVKPLKKCIKNIHSDETMDIIGAYEFKYLASTYNQMYEINDAHQKMLKHKAEHDPLTGIMNRASFDKLRVLLQNQTTPIAFMLVDVDFFKEVNDTYGHEAGDKVLKKVAQLLQNSFRNNDCPVRFGGDEFAVILVDIKEENKSVILEKVNYINRELQNPQNDLPKASISAGVAFSEQGFADNLYRKADQALYRVKKRGRGGCAFYDAEYQVVE